MKICSLTQSIRGTVLLVILLTLGLGNDATASPLAYVANAGNYTVSVLDTASNSVVATVPAGSASMGIDVGVAVSPDGSRVYVADNCGAVRVIDASINTVIAAIPVVCPQNVVVSPDGTRLYVTSGCYNWGALGTVSVVDTATNTVSDNISLGDYTQLYLKGLAISPDGSRLYAGGCFANPGSPGNNVFVLDTATKSVIAAVTVENVWDLGGLVVSPNGAQVYVCHTNFYNTGFVSTLSTATNTVAGTVVVPGGPMGPAVTPNGQQVYVSHPGGSIVSVISPATNTVLATVSVGSWTTGLAVTPDGASVYAANYSASTVSVISTATNTVIATIPVAGGASAVGQFIGPATTPKIARYLLASSNTTPGGGSPGEVFLFASPGIDTLTPLPSIPSGMLDSPNYVAFSPGGELFVSNHNTGSVSRFILDAQGSFAKNGTVTGNSLAAPHGLAFNRNGELFAANWTNGTISRFYFDGQGNPIAHGTIATAGANQGLAFSPGGELFNTDFGSHVRRFLFDPSSGAAIAHGSFAVPGASRLHGLGFNAQGELFIADPDNNRLVRFTFDGSGNPVSHGTISVSGGPIDVAFSPTGELFVSCHFGGGLQRFLFDQNDTAVPNGSVPFVHLGGVAILDTALLGGETFMQADLAGTWYFEVFGDSPSANAPYWGWGTMIIDAEGTVIGGTAVNDSAVVKSLTGGSFTIDAKGQVAGTVHLSDGTTETLPYGKLNFGKKILGMTSSDPVYRHLFMAEKAEGTFAQTDLAGTWYFQYYGDSPSNNAPYWASGTIIVNENGEVTGGSAINDSGVTKDFSGGTLTIDVAGQVSGTMTLNGEQTGTLPHGKLDASKNVLTLLDSSFGYRGIFVMVRGGGAFIQQDLAGTWYFEVFGDNPSTNGPRWGYGTMTVDAWGAVTGGTAVNDSGIVKSLTGGSFTIDAKGRVAGSVRLSDGTIETFPYGALNSGKNFLAMPNSSTSVYRGLFIASRDAKNRITVPDISAEVLLLLLGD